MDINHLKKTFITEAESLLINLDNIIIQLEKNPLDAQYIDEAFRVMHTIKGAGGMYGFDKIVEITHEIESLYDLIRNNKIIVTQALLDLTFAAADHIRELLTDESFTMPNNITTNKLLKGQINNIKSEIGIEVPKTENIVVKNNGSKANNFSTWNILFYPNDELIKRCVNILYTFQDLFALGDYKISNHPYNFDDKQFWSLILVTDKSYNDIEEALLFVLDYCKITQIANFNIWDPVELQNRNEQLKVVMTEFPYDSPYKNMIIEDLGVDMAQNKNAKVPVINIAQKNKITKINVDASKLDLLMYLVSELVTTKSELLIALKEHNELKAYDSAEKIEKLSKLFSENALSIRLVSLQEMLSRFQRLIRDLSKQLGKKIEFTIVGDDTELDKNIIDAISEPVMHLIRNNIDHGIELPNIRTLHGKSETGIIRFEAKKVCNYVYIYIIDDGNGIDTDFVYKKAVEKGFIKEGVELSKQEIIDLIFLPGFSTAQNLSNISGRGVGMDAVLKKIQEIRGEINVSSEKGRGTTFTIKLQQTISIINTLLFSAGNITYAIPVEDIECCELEAHEKIVNRQNNLIEFNKALIPFIHLRDKYSNLSEKLDSETEKLIVINKQAKRYAIVVDKIIGEYQAVIKPIGNAFNNIKFISGASLLGDGSIAILIDADKLWYEIDVN